MFPAALDYMAMTLYIMPKAYREKLGAQEYSQHPVAAGPYKVTRVNGATEVDLERYDGYYPDSPKGKPAIGRIVIHAVPDAATEMAELLGGRQGLGAVACTSDLMALGPQGAAQDIGDRLVVLDDEDAGGGCGGFHHEVKGRCESQALKGP